MTIHVSDGGAQGVNVLTAETTFTVTVLEVNEDSPEFSQDGVYDLTLPEDRATGVVLQVNIPFV